MKKGKTLKTLQKRIKVSKTGKIIVKAISTGHLKAKWDSSKKFRKAGYSVQETKGYRRKFKSLLPGVKIK